MPSNGTSVQDASDIQAAEANNRPLDAAARAEVRQHRATLSQTLQALPLADRKDFLAQEAGSLPTKERTELARQVQAFAQLSVRVRDRLWMIVIAAFAIVLVGAFATLAISVFLPPAAGGTSGQVILTMFTTVVGFLAGLFTTNPVAETQPKPE